MRLRFLRVSGLDNLPDSPYMPVHKEIQTALRRRNRIMGVPSAVSRRGRGG
jgi:hypothetical protein